MSSFASAFTKKAGKALKVARTTKPREAGGGIADVPDRLVTTAVITAEATLSKGGANPGTPMVNLIATIDSGAHEGKEVRNTYFCDGKLQSADDKEKGRLTNEQKLCADLARLLPDADIKEMTDGADVEAALEAINEGTRARIMVRNWVSGPTAKTPGKAGQEFIPTAVLDASGVAATTKDKEEDSEEEEEEESSDEEEGSEETSEEEAEEEEDAAPAKGDSVLYKPKGAKKATKFKVTSVNQSQNTVTVTNDDGKKYSSVPWESIQIVEEDEE